MDFTIQMGTHNYEIFRFLPKKKTNEKVKRDSDFTKLLQKGPPLVDEWFNFYV